MSEMVERAAEAAYEAYRENAAGFPGGSWASLSEWEKNVARAQAEAVLRAIREPTEEQYEALSATNLMWRELNSTKVWQTYIDAALGETK